MKLNYKRTVYVGFAFFLIMAFWQTYDSLVPKILTDRFGMGQGASGIIMALDNILALFLLPLFGALSDKCKTRLGRRTPFILIGTILAAAMLLCMTVVDTIQLGRLDKVSAVDDPIALSALYRAESSEKLQFETAQGAKTISEIMSEEEFCAIRSDSPTDRAGYTDYVVPLRQAYARAVTDASPGPLIALMVILLVALISMGIFRSPAVALMPDVTVKPLRSKANAVINLMGSAGGVIILVLGILLGTGKPKNALMSYTVFFGIVAGLMLLSLAVFLWKVRENKFAEEMQEDSRRLCIDAGADDEKKALSGDRKLTGGEKASLLLILLSVVLWYFGYNAVTSKYSVYAGSVLGMDFNTTLIIAQAAAIVSYIPIGAISSKLGRKKVIIGGVLMLAASFLGASFMKVGSPILLMNLLFALAGIGWAAINVNSYPMVVQLSGGSNVGKYTGFYYTASMAAQTLTPVISGFLMDRYGLRILFPYGTVFVLLAVVTMVFVRHGDAIPQTIEE